jgi:hypothetical protein
MQISKSISSRKFRPDSFIWTLDSCYSICVWIRFLDSFYVRQFNPNLHSSVESLLCKPLINSYANRLVISISSFICIYKRILEVWTKYSHEKINPMLAWNCSFEQMQILKFNQALPSCSNNSIWTLQKKLLRVHAKKMSRKYSDCLKNIIWSFITILLWPKWNFDLYSRYEVLPSQKVVELVLYKKCYNYT